MKRHIAWTRSLVDSLVERQLCINIKCIVITSFLTHDDTHVLEDVAVL